MPKPTRYYLNALFLLVLLGAAKAADAQVDQQRAQAYFKEAQALCERDGGRLWGVSVCAPMVIADRRTQTFATSQPPPDAPRPPEVGLVNATVKWAAQPGSRTPGRTWSTYPAGAERDNAPRDVPRRAAETRTGRGAPGK
jgi:hypothetical protein